MIFGIDYGSKLAGTTSIAFKQNGAICIRACEKKKDADVFILNCAKELRPKTVYIDAPLSLPSVYGGNGTDYFYRKCDTEVQAMSPMFLGGLTARAMRLKSQLVSTLNIDVFECYPKAYVVKFSELLALYNIKNVASLPSFLETFKLRHLSTSVECKTWHQMDSLIAYKIGLNHQSGQAEIKGDPSEGQIIY